MSELSMAALAIANESRCARARLKQDLAAGRVELRAVFDEIPRCCAKVPTYQILQWLPAVGPTKARRLVRGLISESLPLQATGPATKANLLARLGERPTGVLR